MAQKGRVHEELSMMNIGSVGWRFKTKLIAVLVQEHVQSDQLSVH